MDTQKQPNNTPVTPPAGGSHQDFLKQVEDFFRIYLHERAPFHIPVKGKEFIVQYGPWITLILMILAVPVILLALGLTAFLAPAAAIYGGYHFGPLYMLSGLVTLAAFVLEAVALPGLFKRSLKSWQLVYYSVLVSAVGQLLGGQFIGLIIVSYFHVRII